MKRLRLCLFLLIVFALAAAGCSARSPASSALSLSVPVTPTSRPDHFPVGRFVSASEPSLVVLSVQNDGHFQLFMDNTELDAGLFVSEGDRVSVESVGCASHGDKPALYVWLYDVEMGLAFEPVDEDPCIERRQYLAEQYLPKFLFVFNVP